MIRKIVVNNQSYAISQSDVLGSGGEATVIRVHNWAAKIYHPQCLNTARMQKLKELTSFSFDWPGHIYAPLCLAYDSQGRVVGFVMNVMPVGMEVVQKLSSRKFRTANSFIDSSFIVSLFIDGIQKTRRLHAHHIVIGDLNDLNAIFNGSIMGLIDVDSFQFSNHPCMVATENFLDPNLYNLDLSQKPYFRPENDWYSLLVMFIRSLLLTHPYGGFHPQYKTLPERALSRVPVFDSGVKYPKPALSFDLLDQDLQSLCHRVFKNGERPILNVELFEQYRNSLVFCNSCHIQYPSQRKSCPQCSTTNAQYIHRTTKIVPAPGQRKVSCEEVISPAGKIIWHLVAGKTVWAITKEDDTYVLYSNKQRTEILKSKGFHPKFGLFGMLRKYLVINEDHLSDKLMILDLQNNPVVPIGQRVCSISFKERMFCCSENDLWRVQRGFLFRGTVDPHIQIFHEEQVGSIIENQTWITASPLDSTVFGCQRFFHNLRFFLHETSSHGTLQYDVNVPDLDDYESIIDMEVIFSYNALLLLMKTEIKGKTYTRVFAIDKKNGQLISFYRVSALSSDTHRNIHGKAFVRTSAGTMIILHPTDDGVVQEIMGKDCIEKQTLLAETEPFVSESDFLHFWGDGLLVVREDSIDYLLMS